MFVVKQNLLSTLKYNIKAPYKMDAEYITFHNTANDASAASEIKYMLTNNSQVSYHYAIDDKEVVQGIPVNRTAWHCGDGTGKGNMKSIGIEVCYSKSGGTKYDQAEDNAIKFIAQLLHERKWGVDRVKPHKFWSGKNCPHRILNENRWDSVLKEIQNELNKLNAPNKAVGSVTNNVPMWGKTEFRKGQIGKVTILKPINLWKDVNGKLVMARVLNTEEEYRVYSYREDHGGQYNVGDGHWITKMEGYIKYETPSKRLLQEAEEFYK